MHLLDLLGVVAAHKGGVPEASARVRSVLAGHDGQRVGLARRQARIISEYNMLSEIKTDTPGDLASDGELQVLADARPEQVGSGPHVGGNIDFEACDGGFELGRGVGLERELAVRIE